MAAWWVVGTLGGLVAEGVLIIVLGRTTTSRWEQALDTPAADEHEATPPTHGRADRRDWGSVVAPRAREASTTPRPRGASVGQR